MSSALRSICHHVVSGKGIAISCQILLKVKKKKIFSIKRRFKTSNVTQRLIHIIPIYTVCSKLRSGDSWSQPSRTIQYQTISQIFIIHAHASPPFSPVISGPYQYTLLFTHKQEIKSQKCCLVNMNFPKSNTPGCLESNAYSLQQTFDIADICKSHFSNSYRSHSTLLF